MLGNPLLRHLVQLVLELGIVQHPLVVELAHGLHGLVHAVAADADIVGQLEHLARFALRAAADEADIFVVLVVALSGVLGGGGVFVPFCQVGLFPGPGLFRLPFFLLFLFLIYV